MPTSQNRNRSDLKSPRNHKRFEIATNSPLNLLRTRVGIASSDPKSLRSQIASGLDLKSLAIWASQQIWHFPEHAKGLVCESAPFWDDEVGPLLAFLGAWEMPKLMPCDTISLRK